jgi:hypothetical protein
MKLFVNKNEGRARAWIRIPFYIVLVFVLMALSNSLPLGGAQFVFTALVVFGFTWLMFRFGDQRSSHKQLGLNVSLVWWKEFGGGVAIGMVAMAAIFGVEYYSGGLEIVGFGWHGRTGISWLAPVVLFLAQMLSVGFYEEIMSRSYLINNFKEGFTGWKINPQQATVLAIIMSSALFGMFHIANPNASVFALINIFGAGVMLSIPYVLTGRLAYSVGLHFSWNFFQGGVFGFRVSGITIRNSIIQIHQKGDNFFTGGSFGPEAGLIGTIAIIVICAWILWRISQKQKGLQLHKWFTQSYLQNEEKVEEKG